MEGGEYRRRQRWSEGKNTFKERTCFEEITMSFDNMSVIGDLAKNRLSGVEGWTVEW